MTHFLQASDGMRNLLKTENITLLSTITFDESPIQVVRQIKVG